MKSDICRMETERRQRLRWSLGRRYRLPTGYRVVSSILLFACAFLLLFVAMPTTVIGQKEAGANPKNVSQKQTEVLLPIPKPWTGDFDGMRERQRIRILVPFSKTLFFLDQARHRGTAHDLGRAFETWLNKKYPQKAFEITIFFIPMAREKLLSGLVDGLGDIVISNLTITPKRLEIVDFSKPKIKNVKEVVATGPAAPALNDLIDLGAKEIYVRRSSSYYEHLLNLNKKLKAERKRQIKLKDGDENLEDEDLLEMVNAGLLPMVVVDEHKAKFWAQVFPNITVRSDLVIHEGGQIAWAVRKNSPLLLEEINAFIDEQVKKGGLGNQLLKRYLQSTRYVKNATSKAEMERFNKVVSLFQKYGEKYNFEYLMLMAQGYQESRLNQAAVSPKGAVGIMQVLPSTAENPPVNIADVDKNPENNIHAGAKYLRWLIDTYLSGPDIDRKNRILMAFAAYNAGPGNLRKFRQLAEKMGRNPNVWFKNVEHAAARIVGRETVQYVSNIYKYYIAYKLTIEQQSKRINQIAK